MDFMSGFFIGLIFNTLSPAFLYSIGGVGERCNVMGYIKLLKKSCGIVWNPCMFVGSIDNRGASRFTNSF